MRSVLLLSLLFALLIQTGCNKDTEINSLLEKHANAYKNTLFRVRPVTATVLGFHRYDSFLPNVSADSMEAFSRWMKILDQKLSKINKKTLPPHEVIDLNLLQLELDRQIFEIDSLQSWRHDPLYYVNILGSAFHYLMARDFAPKQERMMSAMNRLDAVPGFLKQAMENLSDVPRIHTETAILQIKGVRNLIMDELSTSDGIHSSIENAFAISVKRADSALAEFEKWMSDELLPAATDNFRLGESLFQKKLNLTLELPQNYKRTTLLKEAEQNLAWITDDMFTIARPLYERRKKTRIKEGDITPELKHTVIKYVLDDMAEKHPTADELLSTCQDYLQQATDFVLKKDLVDLPEDPLEIIEVPEFMRGVAVAYCDAPGPFDKGLKTFYMISPIPESWSLEQAESFLKEYNNYQLQDLTIHEAMPGHYVQLTHPVDYSSTVRDLCQSGPYIEGWAVYAEQMMVDEGYGGADNTLLKLAQKKMLLRVIINAIIDQKIHAEGMTKGEAIDLMVNSGFQELSEAEGKWKRACLTSAQLSTYFYGFKEMMSLRKLYKDRHKDDFDLKSFHEKVLSAGAIPMAYLKQVILREIRD